MSESKTFENDECLLPYSLTNEDFRCGWTGPSPQVEENIQRLTDEMLSKCATNQWRLIKVCIAPKL